MERSIVKAVVNIIEKQMLCIINVQKSAHILLKMINKFAKMIVQQLKLMEMIMNVQILVTIIEEIHLIIQDYSVKILVKMLINLLV